MYIQQLLFSRVRLFVALWAVVHQAPLPMGFSRQGYWSGLSFTFAGDLPDPGMEPTSLVSPSLAGGFFNTNVIHKALTWDMGANKTGKIPAFVELLSKEDRKK